MCGAKSGENPAGLPSETSANTAKREGTGTDACFPTQGIPRSLIPKRDTHSSLSFPDALSLTFSVMSLGKSDTNRQELGVSRSTMLLLAARARLLPRSTMVTASLLPSPMSCSGFNFEGTRVADWNHAGWCRVG